MHTKQHNRILTRKKLIAKAEPLRRSTNQSSDINKFLRKYKVSFTYSMFQRVLKSCNRHRRNLVSINNLR